MLGVGDIVMIDGGELARVTRVVVIPADTPVWRSAAEDDRIRTEREARVDVTRPMPQRGIVTKGSGGGTTEDREGEGGVCA